MHPLPCSRIRSFTVALLSAADLVAASGDLGARGPGGHDPAPDGRAPGDPHCFDERGGRSREKCCGHPPHTGCLWGALFSHGYCCDRHSDCFAWGVPINGDDIQDPAFARTGLECRQLCQAAPQCQGWTFILATFPAEELRFSCWLKSRAWTDAEGSAEPRAGLVSGSRHCPRNHNEVLVGLQVPRTMDLSQEPGGCVVRPARDPRGYAKQAADALLHRGWAVVRGALSADEADELFAASAEVEAELLARDAGRVGNRGPRRYSLGSASRTHHMVHRAEWARLIDNPVLAPILGRVFRDDYLAIGGGGDMVLGGTDTVQWLHVDLPRWEMYDLISPPPGVGVNFAVHDVGCQDGPMRLVPDTHTLQYRLEHMAPYTETAMLEHRGLSRVFVCPLRKGDAVLRDLRLWHAGSANRGPKTRHSPNAEFLASWYANLTEGTDDHLAPRPAIPPEVWDTLSEHAQRISERTRAAAPLDTSFYADIAMPQQYD